MKVLRCAIKRMPVLKTYDTFYNSNYSITNIKYNGTVVNFKTQGNDLVMFKRYNEVYDAFNNEFKNLRLDTHKGFFCEDGIDEVYLFKNTSCPHQFRQNEEVLTWNFRDLNKYLEFLKISLPS
jgi:hypothetical protein